jgi:glycosyltransferase involved in cell wall biosynthesis
MKLVSIIIPLYNYEKYIVDCLLSCVNQDYQDVEIIVIDDCSTDRSVEMAKKVNDPRIQIIELNKNRGYSHAKNEGIIKSKGEYITHIDADDALTLVGIIKRVKYLNEHPEVDMVHGRAYKFDGDWSYEKMLIKQAKMKFDNRAEIHAQGVMLRKRVYEKHGLYYEPMRSKADKEMWTRLKICGAKIKKIDNKVAFYRKHPKSMQRMRDNNKKYDKMIVKMYNERIEQVRREGVTKENTRWL